MIAEKQFDVKARKYNHLTTTRYSRKANRTYITVGKQPKITEKRKQN